MTDSNRVRLTACEESTLGTTPGSTRMRTARFTGEGLQFQPSFVQSGEIRADRMNADPIKVNETNQGPINGELSYPVPDSPFASWLRSLFCAEWSDTPSRDNDGVADSVITDVANTTDVVTVTAGDAFVAGHLARFTGFGESGNNGLFKCTTGSATVPAFLGAGFTAEAAPPAAARIKVVGFEGEEGDIAATSTGLSSSSLNFSNLGLAVGQWIKVGGTGSGYRFGTEANNGWARITAIANNALTLDNLPSGWTADAGEYVTLRVFFGDQIKNGTSTFGNTIERGFMGQGTPTYLIQRGMVAGQGEFTFATEAVATWVLTFMGLTGEQTTTSLDSSPDDPTTNAIMAAGVNVGRIAEAGSLVASPNWIRSLRVTINNNLRMINAIRSDGEVGAVDIGKGSFDVSAAVETYFGSNTLLAKLLAGTASNLNARIAKDSQAIIFALPRVTFTEGSPSAGGKNQDVLLNLTAQASYDSATEAHAIIDRLEYYE